MQQQQWIAQGLEGIITDRGKVYNTAADWIRASEIGSAPEEYITDPNSPEAQQVAQQMQQQTEQQAAAQAQQAEQMQQMMMAIEQMKDATDRYQTDVETKFKYYDANLKAEVKEAELTTDFTKGLLKQKA